MRKIAIIGGGKMGMALAQGIRTLEENNVSVSEITPKGIEELARQGFKSTRDNKEAVSGADVVILAVKPKEIQEVLLEIEHSLSKQTIIVSIAAGVKISFLENILPTNKFIRAMPNICATVKAASTSLTKGSLVEENELEVVKTLFESVGSSITIDESLMDVMTGLGGSGPAYIFTVIESLADGAIRMGLPADIAIKIAAEVTFGSAKMILTTKINPSELRLKVTTPGGTTVEGLHKMETNKVRVAFMDAVEASTKRATELSETLTKK